jgi:hypothetical protein
MIRVIAGDLGGGKSYRAMVEMMATAARDPQKIICTNVAIKDEGLDKLGRHRVFVLDDEQVEHWWKHTPAGSATWIDEGVVKFDAQNWAQMNKTNPDFSKYLTHVRKMHDDVTIIIQDYSMLAKRARLLAQEFVYSVSIKQGLESIGLWMDVFPEIFIWRLYREESMRDCVRTSYGWCNARVFDLYDSWAVNTAAGLERRELTKAELAKVLEHGAQSLDENQSDGGWFKWAAAAAVGLGAGFGL